MKVTSVRAFTKPYSVGCASPSRRQPGWGVSVWLAAIPVSVLLRRILKGNAKLT